MVAIIIVRKRQLGTLQLRKSRCTATSDSSSGRRILASCRRSVHTRVGKFRLSRAGAGAWRRPTSDRSESSGVTRTPPLCAGSRSEPREIQLSSCRLHLLINLFISLSSSSTARTTFFTIFSYLCLSLCHNNTQLRD